MRVFASRRGSGFSLSSGARVCADPLVCVSVRTRVHPPLGGISVATSGIKLYRGNARRDGRAQG